jgi:bacterial/archaeal transporter family-2 protein
VIVVLLLVAAAAGAALTVQVACNTQLSRVIGSPIEATLCSFLVGSLALAVYVLAAREPVPSAARLVAAPWWSWIGGLLGGAYVLCTILLAPRLGPGPMFGAIVAGQMAVAVLIEHFGVLGIAPHPASVARVAGIVLIVAGVVLIRRS